MYASIPPLLTFNHLDCGLAAYIAINLTYAGNGTIDSFQAADTPDKIILGLVLTAPPCFSEETGAIVQCINSHVANIVKS